MRLDDFTYDLPPELIAQEPPAERGTSRLLVLDRSSGRVEHTKFASLLDHLRKDDVLVVNDSKVIPARLLGRRVPSGGHIECLLLGPLGEGRWDALVHPGQKLVPGARFVCGEGPVRIHGEIVGRESFGRRTVRLEAEGAPDLSAAIDQVGHVPLPPYIKRGDTPGDRERYQTVFARERGSVAAPTAGLHFTEALLEAIRARGIPIVPVTLHVGYGTFKPVRVDEVDAHRVDPEYYSLSEASAVAINDALEAGRRLVVVGTTTTRALEAAAAATGRVSAGHGTTDLFIRPGHTFRAVGALVTNFHVPRSSLLMLVCAFAGRERVLAAYAEAVRRQYRFYSYGDAMLVV